MHWFRLQFPHSRQASLAPSYHFTRILNEQESYRKSRFSNDTPEIKKEEPTNSLEKKDLNDGEVVSKTEETEVKTALVK